MAPQDDLEYYEATEVQALTRLLRALRPPERDLQVPPPVDLTIRSAIWQESVRRQLSTLLALAHRDLIQVLRQALTENPLLEEGAPAEDADAPAGETHALRLTAAAADLTAAAERYDSIWQACVPDGWVAHGLPVQASEAASASAYPSGPPEALVPDVIVRKVGHDYQVCLNDDGMPQLRLRAASRRLFHEGHMGEPEATPYLDDQLRAAVWLIRSLEYRRQTLLQVATSLVTRQRAFLDHGLAHLQPLALTEVATALGLHASTVRRVVTNKYLATSHGIVALTSCFQSGIESYGGETMSSLTVKDGIKQLIAAEDPATPLTDQQLVEVLAAEHITIARRTVTQYRRELKLPPANRRDLNQVLRQALEIPLMESASGSPPASLPVTETPQRMAAEAGTHPQLTWPSGAQLSPDEEQQVRQILEAPASLPYYQAWLQSRPTMPDLVEEMRAAYRDLQTALAHPQLRAAVLLALRAFAQAAQAGATPPPPADPVPPAPPLQERPAGQVLSCIQDLDHLMRRAIARVLALLEVEGVSIILLDAARQELYFKVADDPRPGHEPRLREVRFPATQGIAGWVVREGLSLIVPDVDRDPRFYRGVDAHFSTKTRSLLCVLLRTQERIIGVLEAINKRQGPLTAEDVRRLEAFANELAPALEQAHAIQERYHGDVQQPIAEAERLVDSVTPFNTLISESPRMQEVFRLVERVRHTTATVLLTGERDSGQDAIARLLHDRGPRAQGPFIAVNCRALLEAQLEAELFGDARGASTGATPQQPGHVELAAGGTLFLEEIDALSPVLQGKLLRVLQEKTFTRVGGTETLTTDVRIIATTHQDLERLMAQGRFRRDLYARLNIYPIALPPLRERQDDLRALTLHFLKQYSHAWRKDVLGMSEEVMGWLERYPWPGNVRELAVVIEQAVARCQGRTVTVQDLPQALRERSRRMSPN